MEYLQAYEKIFKIINSSKLAVVATANNKGIIAASQVCIVCDDNNIYFQTDKSFEKIQNIKENSNISLNIGALSLKGKAEIIGHPTLHPKIVEKFKITHPKTYECYTNLPNEILVKINLTEAKLWGIDSSKTNNKNESILVLDFINKKINTIICDKM